MTNELQKSDLTGGQTDCDRAAQKKMREALPPIGRDEEMDRTYIPIPGGYEIQTKGKGSTFRIAKIGGERYPIPLPDFVHEFLTKMAIDIRAAFEAQQASAAQSAETIARLEEEKAGFAHDLMHSQENEQHWVQTAAAAQADNAMLREALNHVDAYLDNVPHGENCFVSNHYEGDPGNRCNCGKDAVCQNVDDALAHPLDTSALDAYVESKMAGPVGWQWEQFGVEPGHEYADDHWFIQWSQSKPVVTKENERFVRNVMPLFFRLPPAPDKQNK